MRVLDEPPLPCRQPSTPPRAGVCGCGCRRGQTTRPGHAASARASYATVIRAAYVGARHASIIWRSTRPKSCPSPAAVYSASTDRPIAVYARRGKKRGGTAAMPGVHGGCRPPAAASRSVTSQSAGEARPPRARPLRRTREAGKGGRLTEEAAFPLQRRVALARRAWEPVTRPLVVGTSGSGRVPMRMHSNVDKGPDHRYPPTHRTVHRAPLQWLGACAWPVRTVHSAPDRDSRRLDRPGKAGGRELAGAGLSSGSQDPCADSQLLLASVGALSGGMLLAWDGSGEKDGVRRGMGCAALGAKPVPRPCGKRKGDVWVGEVGLASV